MENRLTQLQRPATPSAPRGSGSSSHAVFDALPDRIKKVIELIRPAVQADGGDIEYVGLTPDNVVQIRMHGACVGCPSSTVTLQTGIERNLRSHIPEVQGVEAID